MPDLFKFEIDLSRSLVRCRIPGEPHAWQRVDWGPRGAHDTKKNKEAKGTIQQYIALSRPAAVRGGVPYPGKVGVILLFATLNKRADADNCAKLILDACNKFVWDDDRQVEEIYVRLARGVDPETQIFIYALQ